MIFFDDFSYLGREIDGFQVKIGEDVTDGGNFVVGFFSFVDNKQVFAVKTAESSFPFDGLGKKIFVHYPDVELGKKQVFQLGENVFFVHGLFGGLDNQWNHVKLLENVCRKNS